MKCFLSSPSVVIEHLLAKPGYRHQRSCSAATVGGHSDVTLPLLMRGGPFCMRREEFLSPSWQAWFATPFACNARQTYAPLP
eukprot:1150025-Pelagomonas_calceolata.AAC.1